MKWLWRSQKEHWRLGILIDFLATLLGAPSYKRAMNIVIEFVDDLTNSSIDQISKDNQGYPNEKNK